jgi:glycosyltransferase involved in cell wall biosynthesis
MADFDIFIVPSMYPDPFPRVAIESMALGKPILGYRVGGIDEIIDDGVNGYSFDLEDTDLINKLIDLIEDHELRLRMSFEARKKAVNEYDSRVIATKILSEIESLSS